MHTAVEDEEMRSWPPVRDDDEHLFVLRERKLTEKFNYKLMKIIKQLVVQLIIIIIGQ